MAKKGVIQASILNGATSLGVAPGASITIRDPGGGLSTLWEDRDAAVGQANPFLADANGHFKVYATPGRFQITAVVGPDSQVFDDVVVKARIEPKLPWDAIDALADITPVQDVNIIFPTVIRVQFDAVLSRESIPHALLERQLDTIKVVSGPPGFLEIDYTVEIELLDGVAAAVDGDEINILAFCTSDGGTTQIVGSNGRTVMRADTGWVNRQTIHGHATFPVSADTEYLIDLLVALGNRTSGTLVGRIHQETHLSVRRAIDEDD